MKVELLIRNGATHSARVPYDGADHVTVKGLCPLCGAADFRVRGQGIHTTTHDTHLARAVSVCCGVDVGELRVTMSTIFGIEEDGRVLHGRPRVY